VGGEPSLAPGFRHLALPVTPKSGQSRATRALVAQNQRSNSALTRQQVIQPDGVLISGKVDGISPAVRSRRCRP
jgi:hypothetical protein